MALVPVTLPPGVLRNGTQEQSKAHFYNTSLVRWGAGGLLTQMKGWVKRNVAQTALTGSARACTTWQDNSAARWIGVATNSNLYVQSAAGTVFDITPASFVAGAADASVLTGYGTGNYGVGTFGTSRPDSGSIIPAAMWSLDLWNDKLVGVCASDGRLVQWNLATGTPAAVITNAPTGQQALLVTAEGFMMAFKNRTITWSDQADNTIWAPSDTNQARSFSLQTPGAIQCGAKITGAALILTTADAWRANYVGYPIVYGFTRVGAGCGAVSRGALVAVDQVAFWLGREKFYKYNGSVTPLECDIADLVFGDINLNQLTKVTSGHRAASGEVWWNYCSANSTEINRQAIYNYRQNCWYPNALARTCMADAGPAFSNPTMVSPDGYIYAHESGFTYDGAIPSAETGPLRLGNGERRMEVQGIIPDERHTGDTTLTLTPHDYPNSPDGTPVVLSNLTSPTDFLMQAGRLRLLYQFVGSTPATVGDFMLNIIPGDPL